MVFTFEEGDPADTGFSPEEAARPLPTISGFVNRLKHMLFTDQLSDLVLVVGPNKTRIYAHSKYLGDASDVFLTILFPMPWPRDSFQQCRELVIADFEPVIVQSLLRWIYCDELIVAPGTLVDVIRIAHKYKVTDLISLLETTLATVDKRFTWSVPTKPLQFTMEDLFAKNMNVITPQYLSSEHFLNMRCDYVTAFASLNKSAVTDIHLFTRCLDWAKKECKRLGLELLPANQRKVMEPFIYQIAFPAMPLAEFVELPCKSGILTDDEKLGILRIKNGSKEAIKFRKAGRHGKTCRNWKAGNEYLFRCDQCARFVCNDCFIFSTNNADNHADNCFRTKNGYSLSRYIASRDKCSGSR